MALYPNKKIISLIGPPGSGKGTQASLLADELNYIHFDMGKFLREFYENYKGGDEEVLKEKEKYDSGELNSSSFILRLMLAEIERIYIKSNGIVFSGNPRTVEETEKGLPEFERMVGRDNIFIFYLALSKEVSIKRNSARLVCEKNGHSISNLPKDQEVRNLGICPKDGSNLKKRKLDEPDIIAKRYDVYLRDTEPMLDKAEVMGYKVIKIDGDQPIEEIFEDIKKHLIS